MQNYISSVKEILSDTIKEMSAIPWLFTKTPESDFSRKRKLDFETFFNFFLSMEGKSIGVELLEHFNFSPETATVSAFNQQRSKILPEAFEYLFHEVSGQIYKPKRYDEYSLIACDGSDLNIARNSKDSTTYFQCTPTDKGFNQLHLNTIYDLKNRMYMDAIIQNGTQENEYAACIQMIERSSITEQVILIADRGYENYNLFAHADHKGWKFVIRAKDIHSNGITSGLHISEEGEFDKDFSFLLTRKQTKDIHSQPGKYKFMPSCQKFDYLPVGSKETYAISFRVVRFLIGEDSYETIITNLDRSEFSPDKIKDIYHLRWGIETSFRELKYAIGLTSFHSKKVDYIKQEIFARLLLYNFCEAITTYVVIEQQQKNKHTYQVNFTMAICICKKYLKCNDISPPNVELLIQKYILPVRPGRQDPRKVKPKSVVGFLYRVA
ncbi:IS4 family transposase [[Clostridium] fimetarium]|uniref:Transposase DDE domain-containing protein n=1 Tax=[Clostridium] fimetarium TaxID=99656 RepID=A0A1I0RPQ1_9FIRM|nr:IS4 family transposase [[Clostridium] fimetarium]SEW43065.1 Transposase DDE domain-containing protein [[Clostridium] fimetarium]